MKYVKPEATVLNNLSEGVFAASGMTETEDGLVIGGTCESNIMNGIYKKPSDAQRIDGQKYSYYDNLGCRSCPGDVNYNCACLTDDPHQKGTLKPIWEQKGKGKGDTFVQSASFNQWDPD